MFTERQKMISGEMYDPFDPELLVVARERARDLCQDLNGSREAEQDGCRRILRDFVCGGDDRTRARQACSFMGAWRADDCVSEMRTEECALR